MKTVRVLALLGLGMLVGVWSCRRKEKNDPTPTVSEEVLQEVAQDNARVEGEENFLGEAADEGGEDFSMGRVESTDSVLPACARRSWDPEQRLLIIDFGSTNCLGHDGVYRRGKIFIRFSGPSWRRAGSRAYITTQDFFVNDNQHIVEKVLYHEGLNNVGERIIRDTVLVHRVITPNGTIEWRANRTYRQIQGQNTPRRVDDVWLIEGGAQGTTRRGRPFTTQIVEPLKVVASCQFRVPIKGIWRLLTDSRTVTLNYDPYGNEACDRVASLQVNDRPPVNITLR
ncbi:MAG: hypothetical protein NZ580_04800 [Bacteroidia bacterium]|nr:hypothetical protein [Bacteroidia bacterium]MDW8236269.1 hypothetical protein [Bacteroidia bacterium]